MRRLSAAALVITLAACTSGHGSEAPPSKGAEPTSAQQGAQGAMHFEAVVRVPKEETGPQPGKQFLGAMLVQDDGTEWVVTYRAESPFHKLRGERVVVDGAPYEPPGQALLKRHLRVSLLKVSKPSTDTSLVEIRGEEELTGQFKEIAFPKGTKLEGEVWVRFVDDGGTEFFLAHGDGKPLLGKHVTVTGFRVEPSPYIARPGGPYLWVAEVKQR